MRKESKFRSVIIVEDDDVDAYINRRLVESGDLTEDVTVFLSSVEAIEFLIQKIDKISFPAIVLLDLHMPLMDGFEFLEVLQKLQTPEKEISVVVVTGNSSPNEKTRAQEFPFVIGYVEKPVTISDLSRYFLN